MSRVQYYPRDLLSRCSPAGRMLVTNSLAGALSWHLRPSFLRGRPGRGRVLFAGPWVGEFGWELMNWQGYIRKIAGSYDRVIVSCREGSRALYQDFCDEFSFHSLRGTANCHVLWDIRNGDELARILQAIPGSADHLQPLKYIPAASQDFLRFGKTREEVKTDLLIHARGRTAVEERNWSSEKWELLVAGAVKAGLRVGCIGLPGDTVDVEAIADFRGRLLSETMDAIASSRLVLGPSSGPMHLAALCGTPHLVWTDDQTYSMGKSSRQKYDSWWNPLGTPVTVLDEESFDPPVERVLQEVDRMLAAGSRGGRD